MRFINSIKNFRKRLCVVFIFVFVIGLISFDSGFAQSPVDKKPLNFGKTTGIWTFKNEQTDIAGRLLNYYAYMYVNGGVSSFATFNIAGWDYFQAYIGVIDPYFGDQGELIVKVDGIEERRVSTSFKQKAQLITVCLTGAKTITFEHPTIGNREIIIGEPTLFHGRCPKLESNSSDSRPTLSRKETSSTDNSNQDSMQEILKQLKILNQNIENLNKKIDELKVNRGK